jgi:hypothetical protein
MLFYMFPSSLSPCVYKIILDNECGFYETTASHIASSQNPSEEIGIHEEEERLIL